MDLCNHGGVTIEVDEYGSPCVAYAAHTAAFPREWLHAAGPEVATVDGNRITVCGEAVYEVTDWHHRCPGHEHADTALARLVSRPPQAGDVERLLEQALKSGDRDAALARARAIHPSREEADAAQNALCPECLAPAPCRTRRALDGEDGP